ncbi:phytanoyl-CoA dioxygenase family protein [Paenibacillus nasutitermitis]|uniref:Phytanoyl-CoA dioxygenase n=1 Tax=Paenibacillus nasutitermitis TaxID=1652958 RepID=A0A916Z6C4_9BACL|nr:phytanoyl-CoA dioxygenase family protein [Paenibacillus nasutitermitis]GGD76904.1 phytanoyl-CoA dioxygenase [Paenibacillus nasutitermitis]
MKLMMGNQEMEMGSKYLMELRSSNDLMDDTEALRARLQEDGYLLIRGFHDRSKVLNAHREFCQGLAKQGKLDPDAQVEEGVIGPENKGGMWGKGASELEAEFPSFLEIVNSPKVFGLFDRLLGGPSMTFDYKWPRAVGHGGNTGAHYDIVYMGRGTKNLYTMWTPMADIPLEQGTLAMLLGSQHYAKVRETYGQMDVDRDNVATGWLSDDPIELVDTFGGQWATTAFEAGDLIIFGMFMMHASFNNTTNRYRISSDTRYQLASEPADPRWVGKKPKAHYAWGKEPLKSVEDARKEWGI